MVFRKDNAIKLIKLKDDSDSKFKKFFLHCLFLDVEEPEPRTCVTIDEWIDVWGTIVGKAKNMDDLPMWLQYYPRTLFDVINRTGKLLDLLC